jgi:organic hydroperoxide reductase OsmC/OhrA
MANIAPLPHRYTVTLDRSFLSAPPRTPIALGPPPQFGGTEDRWSPEELLVGAALECLWTTFEAYARRDGLEVDGWSGTGVGVLDKGTPVPVFTSIALSVTLSVARADEERARRLLATAEQRCIISNALKVPINVDVTVHAPLAAAS